MFMNWLCLFDGVLFCELFIDVIVFMMDVFVFEVCSVWLLVCWYVWIV